MYDKIWKKGDLKMNKKTLWNNILIQLLFVAIAIVSAVLIAAIVAFIASKITEDVNTIVASCLIGVWIAIMVVYAIRSRVQYNRRIKLLEINDGEKIIKEKTRLKKWYIVYTIIISIIFGIILHSVYEEVINSINGTEQDITSGTRNFSLILKIIITVVVLCPILIARKLKRKKTKNKKEDETEEQKTCT
jgi:Kef-type K+ transport system membrane component KefB